MLVIFISTVHWKQELRWLGLNGLLSLKVSIQKQEVVSPGSILQKSSVPGKTVTSCQSLGNHFEAQCSALLIHSAIARSAGDGFWLYRVLSSEFMTRQGTHSRDSPETEETLYPLTTSLFLKVKDLCLFSLAKLSHRHERSNNSTILVSLPLSFMDRYSGLSHCIYTYVHVCFISPINADTPKLFSFLNKITMLLFLSSKVSNKMS